MTFLGPVRPPIAAGFDLDGMLRGSRLLRAGGFERATTARAPEHRAASAGTTVESLFAQAAEMALRDRSLTREQHFAKLLKASPQAYNEYLERHPAQTGRR